MINYIFFVPVLVSFFLTLFLLPYWIRKAREIDLVWEDMNKSSDNNVSGSGGIMVILGFVVGVLVFIAYRVFLLKSTNSFIIEIFALLIVILLLSGLAFVDDLLGWRRGGLSKRSRLILVFVSSIPLIAINAGKSVVGIPFFGSFELGILYSLVALPIGIIGATTTYNFLAGFNGLEAGQGIIILSALSLVAFKTGSSWLSVIALCMVAALFAFLIYNYCPARVFPGDSLTYGVGGLIAIMAILGDFEKVAIFFFIPYIIETVLKLRGKLVKHSFGKPKSDGSLGLRYSKIYSLNHFFILFLEKIKIKPTERKVVLGIWIFQIIIILIGFGIFFRGTF